jgi:hypothetical protein
MFVKNADEKIAIIFILMVGMTFLSKNKNMLIEDLIKNGLENYRTRCSG